jgi:hypothetical protein
MGRAWIDYRERYLSQIKIWGTFVIREKLRRSGGVISIFFLNNANILTVAFVASQFKHFLCYFFICLITFCFISTEQIISLSIFPLSKYLKRFDRNLYRYYF